MDEPQEPLTPRTPLLPTGVPHGVAEALRSIRSGRQTRQMPQHIGHDDQTRMVPMAGVRRRRYALQPRCPVRSG